jgi:hypothetical protein
MRHPPEMPGRLVRESPRGLNRGLTKTPHTLNRLSQMNLSCFLAPPPSLHFSSCIPTVSEDDDSRGLDKTTTSGPKNKLDGYQNFHVELLSRPAVVPLWVEGAALLSCLLIALIIITYTHFFATKHNADTVCPLHVLSVRVLTCLHSNRRQINALASHKHTCSQALFSPTDAVPPPASSRVQRSHHTKDLSRNHGKCLRRQLGAQALWCAAVKPACMSAGYACTLVHSEAKTQKQNAFFVCASLLVLCRQAKRDV